MNKKFFKNTLPIHYGWIVLAMGTMGVFGALGLARFGYTTILPAMQADLGINNEQAGLLATFNLSGYLALSTIGGILASKYGVKLTASIGLLLAGVGMIFTGLSQQFGSVIVWRTLTGAGSGIANVSIMGLWSGWFSTKKRGLASGIAVSGSSIALIATGIFVPKILELYGQTAWRNCWFIYGYITVFLALCSFLILKNSASDISLNLIGQNRETPEDSSPHKKTKPGWKSVYLSSSVWYLGFIYMCFGFSYIIYTTFFVKYLVSDHGYTNVKAGNLFMLMGWFSLLCGLMWGIISDKAGRKNTLITLYLFNAVAFGLFAFGNNPFYLTLSAIIFGLSAWSIPAIMAATCGDMLGKDMAPAALGFVTLFFGIGQAVGPTAAGVIADTSKSFAPAFMLASAVSLLGALGSILLIKKKHSGYRKIISLEAIMNKKDILQGLKKLGLKTGDTVMVHSSLSSFGWVEGGAETIVEALLEVLGEKGTLAVPTFSRYLLNGEKVWDRENTPSLMGVISETLRTWPGVIRSSHAAHPIAAIGPNAEALCEKSYKTGFGKDSPFKTLVDMNAYILLMGVGYNKCTIFHFLEVEADVSYRFLEERKATVIIDGVEDKNGSAWEYTRKKDAINDFETFGKLLEDKGLVKKQKIGKSVNRLFRTKDMYRVGMEKLNKDPDYLLKD